MIGIGAFQFLPPEGVEGWMADAVLVAIPPGLADADALAEAFTQALDLPDEILEDGEDLLDLLCDIEVWPQGDVAIIHADVPLLATPKAAKAYLTILHDAWQAWLGSEHGVLHVVFPQDCEVEVELLLSAQPASDLQDDAP